uniref:Uncharacterized protein n=1 Tax=Candidatus Kentrum sp. LPFa TaxID=2126335 RepID=A0A450W660_9GAMM|nr:MAG: hypothetical protein BECKLPF1236B_GA0070989_10365 [Candidatus Kentron sp. LPFa]
MYRRNSFISAEFLPLTDYEVPVASNPFFYYETTAPIRDRRVDKRSASTISSSRWMRCAYPPYAGTFFICWGDETLNMIVKSVRLQKKRF